jgi:hypothetical protein
VAVTFTARPGHPIRAWRWLVRRYYEATHGAEFRGRIGVAIIEAMGKRRRRACGTCPVAGSRTAFLSTCRFGMAMVEIAPGWRIIDRPPG